MTTPKKLEDLSQQELKEKCFEAAENWLTDGRALAVACEKNFPDTFTADRENWRGTVYDVDYTWRYILWGET